MIEFLKKLNQNTEEVNYRKLAYSQCGEDIIIEYIFKLRNIPFPTYLDIGAHHPFFLSNTALFYNKGCRGINVEANPQLIELFRKLRPDDINLNIGIGKEIGELDFYIMEDSSLSSFSKEDRDNYIVAGKKEKEIKRIKLTTVENVLKTYFNDSCPDFMSIDLEGMDYGILQSINFNKYTPKVICVEAAEYSPIGAGARRNELIDFLESKNYYEYANTNLNAIMVKNEFWFI